MFKFDMIRYYSMNHIGGSTIICTKEGASFLDERKAKLGAPYNFRIDEYGRFHPCFDAYYVMGKRRKCYIMKEKPNFYASD